MNLTNKLRYREKVIDRMEIFNANVGLYTNTISYI